MKKFSSTLLLVLVFTALLLMALFLRFRPLSQKPVPQTLLQDFYSQEVRMISFADKEELFRLEKADEEWTLLASGESATPASKTAVDNFLTQTSELKKSDLVSQNQERHEELLISEDQARKIVLKTDTKEYTILFGKQDMLGQFVRLPEDESVYRTGLLSSYFYPDSFK